jgi:transmembrane sensor
MKYLHYSARDFANDSFFIRWIKNPDKESDWFWKSFIKENPSCEPDIRKAAELVSLINFSQRDLTDDELNGMRNRVLMALRAAREGDNAPVQAAGFARDHMQLIKFAAVIILIPLISIGVFFFMKRMDDRFSFRLENGIGVEKRVNPIGQKSVLFLNDGTKVWLNAASRISYAKDFGEQGTRDVYLDGEAFFDVVHNPEKPFIVHTSNIRIKVLGTSFNVKSYLDEKTVETTLVHGKVHIEQSDVLGNRISDIELKPNQRAVFNKESKVIDIKEVVAENSGSWKRDRLVFDEETIDNVFRQMERWYNVRIHVQNKGDLQCKLTARIEDENLEDVLKLMKESYDLRYTIEGKDVFIEGKLCGGK